MRDSIAGTWLLSLVLVFMLIFVSYLAVSVNYSKAFNMKDRIISIIEESEGHGERAQNRIESYMAGSGYYIRTGCGNRGTRINPPAGGTYCIDRFINPQSTDEVWQVHYRVTIFFRFDLPVLGHIFTFPVTGETKTIHCFQEDDGRFLGCPDPAEGI